MTNQTTATTSETTRFVKFMTVGGIGFFVDAGTFFFFSHILGMSLLVGQAFSFSIAVINNFILNRHWTFPEARSKSMRRQLVQFYVTNLVGLFIRSFTIAVVSGFFQAQAALYRIGSLSPELVSNYASLMTAIAIVSIWNYFVNRWWTFGDVA